RPPRGHAAHRRHDAAPHQPRLRRRVGAHGGAARARRHRRAAGDDDDVREDVPHGRRRLPVRAAAALLPEIPESRRRRRQARRSRGDVKMDNETKPRLEPVPRDARPSEAPRTPPAAAVDAEAEPPKNKRRPFVIVGIVVAVLLLGIGGYLLLTAGEEGTDDAAIAADMVPVGTRVAGQVVKVHVIENQLVHKGDVIAEIDPADYAARVQQAEADLASQEAQAAAADAQVAVTEDGSKGGLSPAKASLAGSTVSVGS